MLYYFDESSGLAGAWAASENDFFNVFGHFFNSQLTIHIFRASRVQSRIHSDFAEAQPKIEANASIDN